MKKRPELPKSNAQRDIIRSLNRQKELTFTQLQKILNVSRKTLSHHISELKKEGSIQYEKRGREKYYTISNSISEIFERQSTIFANNYLDHLVKDSAIKDTHQRIYESVERKLATYFLFGIIKSIQTGNNWVDGFDPDILLYMIISSIYDKITQEGDDSKLVNNANDLEWGDFFENAHKLYKLPKNKKNVCKMYDNLKKRYPDEVKELEKLTNTSLFQN